MLAPKHIPDLYQAWNIKNGAPFGRDIKHFLEEYPSMPKEVVAFLKGPFSLQGNNTTRGFEYPWAFYATELTAGMNVVEVGGGLSGFQFALNKQKCNVVNIDPGRPQKGSKWRCDTDSMKKLNQIFGTNVTLINSTISDANLSDSSFDRSFCISVIDHLAEASAKEVMEHIYRFLVPGGMFIITVDLFLDLKPFTSEERNRHGINQNIKALCATAPWEMMVGNPAELLGFQEFDVNKVKTHLKTYLLGQHYPVLTQCLVLKKPD